MVCRNSPRTRLGAGALFLALSGALCISACSKSSAPSTKTGHHATKKSASKKKKVPTATRKKDGSWNVAATGSRFDPPIKIDEVPQGSWYCDMGTVHYAQSEAGDKTCKICKMKLSHKGSEAAATPKH